MWVARNIARGLSKLGPWPEEGQLKRVDKQEYAFGVHQDGEQRTGSYFNDAEIDVHGSNGLIRPDLGASFCIALTGFTRSTEMAAVLRHGHQLAPCAWISHHEGERQHAQENDAEM